MGTYSSSGHCSVLFSLIKYWTGSVTGHRTVVSSSRPSIGKNKNLFKLLGQWGLSEFDWNLFYKRSCKNGRWPATMTVTGSSRPWPAWPILWTTYSFLKHLYRPPSISKLSQRRPWGTDCKNCGCTEALFLVLGCFHWRVARMFGILELGRRSRSQSTRLRVKRCTLNFWMHRSSRLVPCFYSSLRNWKQTSPVSSVC